MSNKITKVVEELNDSVFCISEEFPYTLWFEHVSLPVGDYIKYAGQYIYDSENDDRPWINDDEQQDLKEFILDQMTRIQVCINKTRVKIENKEDE